MLVVMNANATEAEIAGVVRVIEALGLRAHTMPVPLVPPFGITGNKGAISLQHFENLPGVAEAIRVSKPYKLITLDLKQDRTIVEYRWCEDWQWLARHDRRAMRDRNAGSKLLPPLRW